MCRLNNPLTREFTNKVRKLERFAVIVEEALQARASALDEALVAGAENYSQSERQDLFEYHAEDFLDLSDELPSILRYSVVTAADSAVEHYLKRTADRYSDLRKASVRMSDLTGSGLERAQQYFKKVAQITFPDSAPTWTAILRLRELRGCLVHADGYVSEDRTRLARWLGTTSGIRLSPGRTVALEASFTRDALGWYATFASDFDAVCAPLGLFEAEFPLIDVE
jgi:hypothetical protein